MQGNTQSEAFQDGTVRPKPFLALAIPLRGLVTGLVWDEGEGSRRSGAPPFGPWPCGLRYSVYVRYGLCAQFPMTSQPPAAREL